MVNWNQRCCHLLTADGAVFHKAAGVSNMLEFKLCLVSKYPSPMLVDMIIDLCPGAMEKAGSRKISRKDPNIFMVPIELYSHCKKHCLFCSVF